MVILALAIVCMLHFFPSKIAFSFTATFVATVCIVYCFIKCVMACNKCNFKFFFIFLALLLNDTQSQYYQMDAT